MENIARNKAVEIHDMGADWFSQQYKNQHDPYSSPFLYGRKLIDSFFQKEIKSLPANARILDVGCGTGEQIKILKEMNFNVEGIEPSEKMLKYSVRILGENIIKKGSVLRLPYPDNSFDFVFALEVFRYLDHTDNIGGLQEIYRVLKPSGKFFGTFVNKYALDGFFLITQYRKAKECLFNAPMKCHTEFETPVSLKNMLANVGFSEIKTHGAMLAMLRLIYAISPKIGKIIAGFVEPADKIISDLKIFKSFSGHLIGIAKK